jgi:predicted DCC family thiol-disulfide oxidoreductase YuxK
MVSTHPSPERTRKDAAGSRSADIAGRRAIVLYDGQCPFCRATVGLLRRLDWLRQLHFQDCRRVEEWPSAPVPLTLDRLLEEMHLITPDRQRVYAGYRAFRWMAWRLPLLTPWAPWLYLPGIPWLGQRLYQWVAKHRYQLIPCRDGVCQVIPPTLSSRSQVKSPRAHLAENP